MNKTNFLAIFLIVPFLSACSASMGEPVSVDEEIVPPGTTEGDLNAPVDGTDGLTPETSADQPTVQPMDNQPYFFPAWSSSFGISKSMYERAQKYYDQHWSSFSVRRYVVIIDMGLHSSKKRFVLFDLKTGKFEKHNVAHGSGSDPDKDGWVERFSNAEGSNATSVGFYKTLYTYNGNHGRSLKIDGLESTNNNALARAVVIHGADYVSDKNSKAGRSWGCPALDNAVVQGVIDKLQGGAMLLIATSRTL
jgi:hypothetical protein